jgi:hypothetical protein
MRVALSNGMPGFFGQRKTAPDFSGAVCESVQSFN